MQKIQLSDLEKNVHSIIKSINCSNETVLVVDKEKLLVKIVPVLSKKQESWLGCMKGTGKITGDIISPIEDLNNWEALSE